MLSYLKFEPLVQEQMSRHMRLNPMRIISALINAEIIYLFLMYGYLGPRTSCPPSLVERADWVDS